MMAKPTNSDPVFNNTGSLVDNAPCPQRTITVIHIGIHLLVSSAVEGVAFQ